MIYSFRAEYAPDVERFLAVVRADAEGHDGFVVHVFEQAWPGGYPDVAVEGESFADLATLRAAAERGTDLHVIAETLRAVPLAENTLERCWER